MDVFILQGGEHQYFVVYGRVPIFKCYPQKGTRYLLGVVMRAPRITQGGYVYHVLNRANSRQQLFANNSDYATFERVLFDTVEIVGIRLLSYCIMPNHWHLVLQPQADGVLSQFMQRLTLTHTQRWHVLHDTSGHGHLYQGRFKSFIIESDSYLLMVCRYVERNALRANLVSRAEQWRWSSLWWRVQGEPKNFPMLTDLPVARPADWLGLVNRPQPEAEIKAIRYCVKRGAPFGCERWVRQTAEELGLQSTLRSHGRPSTKGQEKVPGSFLV